MLQHEEPDVSGLDDITSQTEQVATVLAATARTATTARVIPAYSSGGAKVHPVYYMYRRCHFNVHS